MQLSENARHRDQINEVQLQYRSSEDRKPHSRYQVRIRAQNVVRFQASSQLGDRYEADIMVESS